MQVHNITGQRYSSSRLFKTGLQEYAERLAEAAEETGSLVQL